MRHAKRGRKLGRTSAHRTAMFRNALQSLVLHGRIKTTLPKAKEIRRLADRLITHGKTNTLASRRQARRWLSDVTLVQKLFDDVAPRFEDRSGGYTRVLKLGRRLGDNAEEAILEWVDYDIDEVDD